MKKRYLVGIAVATLVGGALVACGSGDVSKASSEDSGNLVLFDSSWYAGRMSEAMDACEGNPACAGKLNGVSSAAAPSSSSSTPIVEPGESSSSATVPVPGSSAIINFSSSAGMPSSASIGASSSSIVADGTVNGTCEPKPAVIEKGASTVWTFNRLSPAGMAGMTAQQNALFSWTMPNSAEGQLEALGKDKGNTATATYAASGAFSATLNVDGNTIQCSELQVNGASITGCECAPASATVDVASGAATATWTVSGCKTDANITGYTWTGATGSGETATASLSKKGDVVTPTVTVMNDDNTKTEFTCASVKAVDSSAPEYEIPKANATVILPGAGTYTISMGATNPGGCQIWCKSPTGESWSASVNGGVSTSGDWHKQLTTNTSDCAGSMTLELTGATSNVECGANWW